MSGDPLPGDLKEALDLEFESLADAGKAEGVPADLVRFTTAVARAQASAQAAVRRAAGGVSQGEASLSPVAVTDEIHLDTEILGDLLRELAGAIAPSGETGLATFLAAAQSRPELLDRIARASLREGDPGEIKDVAGELDVPIGALLLLGRLLAAPFVREARRRRGPLPEVDARCVGTRDAGRCPTCGSPPGLAALEREAGARRLFCFLCGDAWLAPRLMCPVCGSKDQGRLGTICADEADPRWIEVCEACRRYLKTVDERRLPTDHVLVPRAEEVRTTYLDLIAEEQGYVRSTF